MKRILEVEGEVEKMLHGVLDAALKSAGMAVLGAVNQVISSIKQVEEKAAE